MTTIIARGIPKDNWANLGNVSIIVRGNEREIESVRCVSDDDVEKDDEIVEYYFEKLMEKGPEYPLGSDPDTMLRASQVLSEQFYNQPGCEFSVDGPIEEMPNDPNVIY